MTEAAALDIRDELSSTPYEHLRALARGGMGEVHVVRHRALRDDRVLKVVRDLGADTADVLARRMIAEGRLLRGLRHPNIVETLDLGVTKSGKPYLVTELLLGCTLKDEVGLRGPLGAAEVVDILEGILQGIQVAHESGIAHRDLKPLNVFYTGPVGEPSGRVVKLIDFGIAKVLSDRARDRAGSALVATAVGWAMGSPSYMPPEQVVGHAVDSRADFYAIGCIGHFLLTGRPPFGGASQSEIMANQIIMPAPRLHPNVPGVPEALSELLEQAMAKEPDKRFQSAQGMRGALAAVRAELGRRADASVAARERIATRPAPAALTRQTSAADLDTIVQPPQLDDVGDTTPDPSAAERARVVEPESLRGLAPRTQRVPPRPVTSARRGLTVAVVVGLLVVIALLSCVLYVEGR